MPLIRLKSIEVCTVRLSASSSFAPRSPAASTFAPTERPTNRFVRRLTSAEVDPTAASERSPAKRPTTTMSAALNNSWRMLENISGTAKAIIFFRIGPSSMSIV